MQTCCLGTLALTQITKTMQALSIRTRAPTKTSEDNANL
jgi:hypothetical protein